MIWVMVFCIVVFVILPEITGTMVTRAKIAAERDVRLAEAKNEPNPPPEDKKDAVGFFPR